MTSCGGIGTNEESARMEKKSSAKSLLAQANEKEIKGTKGEEVSTPP
jgi:hypothetical protein